MAQRSKLSRSGSNRLFKGTVTKAHVFNRPRPMRGGTRL